MKANAILINSNDNVVTVVEDIKKGQIVRFFNENKIDQIVANQDIPACHKIALIDINKGQHVIKYGETIGGAIKDINIGFFVAHHNIESLPRDYDNEL